VIPTLLVTFALAQADDDWPPKPRATETATTSKAAPPASTAAGAATASKDQQTILVLDLTVGPEISPDLPRTLSEQLTVLVRVRNPQFRVLGMTDVREMIALEAQKARLNCQEVSCLAEIGGALGAREVVNGSLARIGGNFIVTLKRVNAKQARVLADATKQVPRDREGDLIDALRAEVAQLFPNQASAAPRTTDDLLGDEDVPSVSKSHTTGYLLLGAAAVGVAALIAGAVMYTNFQSLKTQAQTPNTAVAVNDIASAQTEATVGTALIFAGAAIAAGGTLGSVLTW
jgi:hypothetical protein